MRPRKLITNILLPVTITAAILYFFFRDISLLDIRQAIINIPLHFLLAYLLLSICGTLLRTLKYRILIAGKITFASMFLITLVRNFSVDLLPARTASLVFYSYLAKREGVSVEEGASSFVISMFYDSLALSVMLGSLVFFLADGVGRSFIYIGMTIIFALSIMVIFLAEYILSFILKIAFLSKFPRITIFFGNILDYLRHHKNRQERAIVFLLSLVIRLIKYVSVFILFAGIIGIPFSLKYFAMFCFGLAGTELSSLLPLQGAGGFGTWELAFALVFKGLQFPLENVKLTGLVIHIITQAWEYLTGIAAFLYMVMHNHRNKAK